MFNPSSPYPSNMALLTVRSPLLPLPLICTVPLPLTVAPSIVTLPFVAIVNEPSLVSMLPFNTKFLSAVTFRFNLPAVALILVP